MTTPTGDITCPTCEGNPQQGYADSNGRSGVLVCTHCSGTGEVPAPSSEGRTDR